MSVAASLPNQLCVQSPAVLQSHYDLVCAVDNMVIADDITLVSIDYHTGAHALALPGIGQAAFWNAKEAAKERIVQQGVVGHRRGGRDGDVHDRGGHALEHRCKSGLSLMGVQGREPATPQEQKKANDERTIHHGIPFSQSKQG